MKRRDFLRRAATLSSTALATGLSKNAMGDSSIDFSQVNFSQDKFNQNNAQVIMVFLYGGASELAGNLTNINQIKQASQSNYDNYFRGITPTSNGFWQEAGGTSMESLLTSGDLNVFRTCFSQLRDDEGNRSHGRCVSQNQRGINGDSDTAGIFSAIANTLSSNGVINQNTQLPFLTMEGESEFFSTPNFNLEPFLNPVALSSRLSNPYKRNGADRWFYYTSQELAIGNYQDNRAELDLAMDQLAENTNKSGKIQENFKKRSSLDSFIEDIKAQQTPDSVSYPENNFAKRLENAIKIMSHNADTKIISLGSSGLGSWDDHNEARDYTNRMQDLFASLESAVAHIKAENKQDSIGIMVWGEFGRNVNLNSALGWDHGNLQNLYTLCGGNYFNHVGVVGETQLTESGQINRLYLKPTETSYQFEPYSVAATLYKIFGITNPDYLTGGFSEIKSGLFKT
jgi:hypothetical protein